jgi:hypothetical protein
MTLTRFLKVSLGDLLSAEDQTNGLFWCRPKPTATNAGVLTQDISAALEASTASKASAGVCYEAFGRIDSTAATGTYYVLAINAASLPANGAVTLLRHPIKIQHIGGIDSEFDFKIPEFGFYATTGFVFALSSTEFTLTVGGAYLSMTIGVA